MTRNFVKPIFNLKLVINDQNTFHSIIWLSIFSVALILMAQLLYSAKIMSETNFVYQSRALAGQSLSVQEVCLIKISRMVCTFF